MNEFELFPKEWTVSHAGHEIRVRNSWNRGMKLFVDGVCQAATNRIFVLSPSKPILSHQMVAAGGAPFTIEVFCHALFAVKAKIAVDGRQIGGDDF